MLQKYFSIADCERLARKYHANYKKIKVQTDVGMGSKYWTYRQYMYLTKICMGSYQQNKLNMDFLAKDADTRGVPHQLYQEISYKEANDFKKKYHDNPDSWPAQPLPISYWITDRTQWMDLADRVGFSTLIVEKNRTNNEELSLMFF